MRGKKEINGHKHEKLESKNENEAGPSDQYAQGPSSSKTKDTREKSYKCRICNRVFENRRRLYLHQNLDHQKGEGENLKSRPWDAENAPHGDDKSFKEVYEANKRFILEGNTDDEVQATVNVPLNNDINIDTIISEITDIAQRETRAFKVQFSFGFILRHVDTGDFRYFIPDRNETVLNRPFFISTMADVEKLRRELEALDLMHHLLKNRKDTKWKLFF